MLTTEQINDLHRLYWSDHWPIRKIERHLHMGWETIKKYLDMPAQTPAGRPRSSKLDRYKATIAELLEKDPSASAAVIGQRLQPLGYTGGGSILRQYVREVRPQLKPQRAFVRMEPKPGERFEVDWGHFESLDYQGDQRKLYAFALVDGHSRMQYLEFTHSQSFETFVRCHVHAFQMLNGIARELWYDNLATAVAEHDGRLVRFNPRFLAFAREFNFYPRACNQASGWEKGKVERGGIGYVRQNFWPLRDFLDLHDVNRQAREWLDQIANRRLHSETRERPIDRFQPDALRCLPVITPDYRDTVAALVHKDIRLHANHLFLLSRKEYQKCAVFLLQDLDTQRVYRLYDFTKALLLRPGVAYSVAGKVNSADKLYLVLESVRLDTKHSLASTAPVPAEGAGGSGIG